MHRLVLCAAFTSFRDAAGKVGWPRSLAFSVPDIWRTKDTLRRYRGPCLLVHGALDQFFPTQMAVELRRSCGLQAELIVVPPGAHSRRSLLPPATLLLGADRRLPVARLPFK